MNVYVYKGIIMACISPKEKYEEFEDCQGVCVCVQ